MVKLLNVAANRYRLALVSLFCMHAPVQFSKYFTTFVKEQIPENPVCKNSKMLLYIIIKNLRSDMKFSDEKENVH